MVNEVQKQIDNVHEKGRGVGAFIIEPIISCGGQIELPEGFLTKSYEYVRAAVGGVGKAKTGGNYAASLLAGKKAREAGCNQVLWLDGKDREYIEVVGAMNI